MSIDTDQNYSADGRLNSRDTLSALVDKIRRYYLLLITTIGLFVVLSFCLAAVVEPTYTASAEIGPPQSTLSSGLLSGASGGALAMLGSKLGHGGLFGGGNDSFSTYTELLSSDRLARALADQKGVLETVFYTRYDAKNRRWRNRAWLVAGVMDALKALFHYPVKSHPTKDDLARFLSRNMDVQTSLTSSFVTVSLKFHDPVLAQQLLKRILATADNIVRSDTRADVGSRLAYLTKLLPTVTQADQRDSLITVLSTQEQAMMMLAADKRIASQVVDPPYADPRPSFPDPVKFLAFSILLGIIAWATMVHLLPPHSRLLQLRFRRRSHSMAVTPDGQVECSVAHHWPD